MAGDRNLFRQECADSRRGRAHRDAREGGDRSARPVPGRPVGRLDAEAALRAAGERTLRDRMDWPRMHLFWGDERCVPPDHPDSNYRMTREALIDHVALPPENVHRIHGEDEPEQAAERVRASAPRIFRSRRDARRAASTSCCSGWVPTATRRRFSRHRGDHRDAALGDGGSRRSAARRCGA